MVRKQPFAVGVLLLLVAFILTIVLTDLAATYDSLQPLALLILILAAAGAIMTGYSIWDEVIGKATPRD